MGGGAAPTHSHAAAVTRRLGPVSAVDTSCVLGAQLH